MYEIALIERYSTSHFGWENLIQKNKLNLSVEQILFEYQGFEGDAIFFSLVEEHLSSFNEIINHYRAIRKNKDNKGFILHILSENFNMPSFIRDQVYKVGYEVGVCEGDSVFSSIFNEIIFGNFAELLKYKKFLNESLLFPNKEIAQSYVALHNKLSADGVGVEDWMEMKIYEIWKQNDL